MHFNNSANVMLDTSFEFSKEVIVASQEVSQEFFEQLLN